MEVQDPPWLPVVLRGQGPHYCALGMNVPAPYPTFSDALAWGKEWDYGHLVAV